MSILVAGARGHIGSAVLQALSGTPDVIAGVSRAADAEALRARGQEARAFDYADYEQMLRAFAGIETLVLVFPFAPAMLEYADRATRAAQAAGVKHVVRSSGLGASLASPYLLSREQGEIDALVRDRSRAWTLVLPGFFMQNMVDHPEPLRATGVYRSARGGGRTAAVDVREVGAAVAAIAREPRPHTGASYQLTGPRAESDAEVVADIAAATGRALRCEPVSAMDLRMALASAGMPDWAIDRLASLDTMVREGEAAELSPDLARLLGRAPTGFADFAREHRAAWLA